MKESFKIWKLKFHSPLHLSKGKSDDYGVSEEIIHSDTLKSALYVCAKELGMTSARLNDTTFFESFRVTSAFPFFKNELFFPKPMLKLQPFVEGDFAEEKQAKTHKKISYIGQSYFEDIIDENKLHISKSYLSKDGKFLSSVLHFETLDSSIMESDVQQRVTIPRDYAGDPIPYYVDRLFFTEEAGLWFAFMGNEEVFEEMTKALILLGDYGIGTDRNVGNGQFTVEVGELQLRIPQTANYQVSLSLWCPKKEEIEGTSVLENSRYNLLKRGGYIASPASIEHLTFRKKSIYMFSEGSVFPASISTIGKIVDLKPDISTIKQSVWRDGQGFMIPVKNVAL